jgi:GT2 family glycosyltransferase
VHRRHRPPNLASLAASLPLALDGLRGELIVALNGVSANAADVPREASIVTFDVNRGVPVAWNAAARRARADSLCVVNDDVVLGPGSLRALHRALANETSAGAVGPVGTHWDIAAGHHVSYVEMSNSEAGTLHECEVLSGFLFATPTRVYEQVRGFDEAYTPCGFEEVDYCTAVRLRAGLRCFAVAGVDFSHEFGISAARPWRSVRYDGRREMIGKISRRNRLHFLAKWSAIAGAELVAAGSGE